MLQTPTNLTLDYVKIDEPIERVARITIDRPGANAADTQVLRELHLAFDSVHEASDIDAVLLTGAGKVFCSGNDIHEFAKMNSDYAAELMYRVRRAFWALHDCPVPVVARVNGVAFGTGIALASLSDVVIASDRAVFGLTELDVGVLGGLKFARRFVPEHAVRRMFFTAETYTAQQFRDFGAVISVVPHDSLDSECEKVLRTIVDKGSVALRMAKQCMNAVEHLDFRIGYEYEQSFTIRMADRPESKAAVKNVIDGIEARKQAKQDRQTSDTQTVE